MSASSDAGQTHSESSAMLESPEPTVPSTVTAEPGKKHVWTTKDVALALNYADLYLEAQDSVYKEKLVEELSRNSGNKLSVSAIQSKIRLELVKYGKGKARWPDLMSKGTNCLDLNLLPGRLFDEMESQRKGLNLPALKKVAAPKRATTEDTATVSERATKYTATRMSRRAKSAGRQKSYCEETESNSGHCAADDDDYNEGRGRKIRSRKGKQKIGFKPNEPTQSSSAAGKPSSLSKRQALVSVREANMNAGASVVDAPVFGHAPLSDHINNGHSSVDKDSAALKAAVGDLADIVAVLYRQQIESGPYMSTEVEGRLRCIMRTVQREPIEFLEKMLQDLHSADAARADMRDLVNALVDHREINRSDNFFPKNLKKESVDKGWKAIRRHIQDASGFPDCECLPPRPEDAGYIAARIDDLASNQRASGLDSPKKFLEELSERLGSVFSVQAVLGALFCGWLFSGPEPMCDGIYSQKEQELYRAVLPDRGAVEVQRLDKLSMKLLFENEEFKSSLFLRRAEKLLASLVSSYKQAWPDALAFQELNCPQDWAESAVKFKQTLMISPAEFRIHHCMPGTLFDPELMEGEDVEGFPVPDTKAEGKVISVCLFPALTTHEAPPFPQDPALADVLVTSKRFFPTMLEKQKLDTKRVVSKAAVLVV